MDWGIILDKEHREIRESQESLIVRPSVVDIVYEIYTSELTPAEIGEICIICLESLSGRIIPTIYRLHCGHIFHPKCIGKWLEQSALHTTCPTCRTPINLSLFDGCKNTTLSAQPTSNLLITHSRFLSTKDLMEEVKLHSVMDYLLFFIMIRWALFYIPAFDIPNFQVIAFTLLHMPFFLVAIS